MNGSCHRFYRRNSEMREGENMRERERRHSELIASPGEKRIPMNALKSTKIDTKSAENNVGKLRVWIEGQIDRPTLPKTTNL